MRFVPGSFLLFLMVQFVQAAQAPIVVQPARAMVEVSPDSVPGQGTGRGIKNSGVVTRLFLIPTARPPGAGHGQFSLHELFFPSLEIGITDRFGVTGGVSLVPGADSRVTFISPKYTPVRTGALDLAIGGWYMKKSGQRGGGAVYGNITYGDSDRSLTFGTGWGLTGTRPSPGPIYMGGFSLQVTPETDIISESIFPPNRDPAVLTVGMRFYSKKFSAEIAAMVLWGIHTVQFIPIPWTSFSFAL